MNSTTILPMLMPSKKSPYFNAGNSCTCGHHLVKGDNYIPISKEEGLYYCNQEACRSETENDCEEWKKYLKKAREELTPPGIVGGAHFFCNVFCINCDKKAINVNNNGLGSVVTSNEEVHYFDYDSDGNHGRLLTREVRQGYHYCIDNDTCKEIAEKKALLWEDLNNYFL